MTELAPLNRPPTAGIGGGIRVYAPARRPRCGSPVRPDVALFGEAAPAYRRQGAWLRDARPADALVVIGTRGNVSPVSDVARAFPGRTLLNNLHSCASIDDVRFDRVSRAPATDVADDLIAVLETWRREGAPAMG